METRQEPTPPFDSLALAQGKPHHAATLRPLAEAARLGVTVRVMLDEHQDEEEKEAGYGHGV